MRGVTQIFVSLKHTLWVCKIFACFHETRKFSLHAIPIAMTIDEIQIHNVAYSIHNDWCSSETILENNCDTCLLVVNKILTSSDKSSRAIGVWQRRNISVILKREQETRGLEGKCHVFSGYKILGCISSSRRVVLIVI